MTKSWPTISLEELASVQRGKFSARPRNDPKYYGGKFPFIQTGDVSNGAGRVRSYSQTLNDEGLAVSKLFPRGSLVITIAANIGDVAKVEFDFACPDSLVVVQANEGVDSDWLQYSLESKKELLDSLAPQNAQKNINLEVLRPLPFDVPTLGEQRRIAAVLVAWDTAIQKTEQLIAAKERSLQALMRSMLQQKKHPAKRISTFTHRVTRKNTDGNGHPLTISGAEGLVSQSKYYGKRIAAESAEHYTLIKRGEFAYNRSSSSGYPFGAIKRLNVLDEGVVSTLYLCFALNEDAPLSDYFAYYCESGGFNRQIYQVAQEGARNHGLLNITADDFFSMSMPIPPREEQVRAVTILNTATQEVSLLKSQLLALRTQKRGLMQKLLTAQWRLPTQEGMD